MAEEKSGWSNLLGQSGVINYPLLGLVPNIMSKGYQYQSQPSYPQRDARGDWGRAINESLNQYFSQLPQYYQQVRSNQLTQQQIAQQKIQQERDTKLFNLKMQEVERAKKIRENYPKTVQNLPIADEAKKYLLTLDPPQGMQVMQSLMTKFYESKFKAPVPKGRPLTDAELKEGGFPKGTFFKPDGTYGFPNEATIEFMQQGGTEGKDVVDIFKTKYAGPNEQYQTVVSLSQLPGDTLKEKQRNAVTLLPEGHDLRGRMELEFYYNGIVANHNNILFPNYGKFGVGRPSNSSKQNPPRIAEHEVQPGDSLSGLAQQFRNQGYDVSEDLLFTLNPEHFVEDESGNLDRNQLKHFGQTSRLFQVPESKGDFKIDPNKSKQIQQKSNQTSVFDIPGYGQIIKKETMSADLFDKYNRQYNTSKNFKESIEDLLTAIETGQNIDPRRLGRDAGLVQTIHRRLMRLQQDRGNMGVLSPGEIPFLEETIQDPMKFVNWFLGESGKKEFVNAVYQGLREEAMREMAGHKAFMSQYGKTPIEYPRGSSYAPFVVEKASGLTNQKLEDAGLN